MRKGLAIAASAAVLGFAVPACSATASNVSCGAHLTSNTTLTKDLVCPLGKGLSLDGPITLNLGGHRLVGPGVKSTGSIGVTGFLGGKSAVVNGQIQGWGTGVSENNFGVDAVGSRLTLDKVTMWRNATAADVEEVALSVTSSKFQHNQRGIFGFFAQIAVHDTNFVANGAVNGGGGNLSVDRSTFDGNGSGEPAASCSESGLSVTRSVIVNFQRPVGGFDCAGVILTGNRFLNNAFAFQSTGDLISPPVKVTDGEQIIGNTFTNNGIAVQSGVSGRIANNTFTGNTTGLIANSNSALVTGNTFSHNKSSGLRATSGSGMRIGSNVALSNGRSGIYAPGARDLGGNKASGNGLSPQCVGVVCTS